MEDFCFNAQENYLHAFLQNFLQASGNIQRYARNPKYVIFGGFIGS